MSVDREKEELHRRARAYVRLERYAEVLACLGFYGYDRLPEILPRIGLTREQWLIVDEAWTYELSEGIRRKQSAQGLRFSATFAKMRQKLMREQPRLELVALS
jgi:hypothetical protein